MGSMLTIITGVIARDPEMSYTGDGNAITRFTMPVNQFVYNSQSKKKEQKTTWVNCTAYGVTAENINKLCRKGSYVQVSGDDYTERAFKGKDGKTKLSHDISVRSVQFITKFGETAGDDDGDTDDLNDLLDDDSSPDVPRDKVPF